jgi:cellobiose phosphorylase
VYDVLLQFADLAEGHQDPGCAQQCRDNAKTLQQNLAQHAWDGAWYKRAWFDDGAALGAASNSECRIDSIAQSWSVLSGAATPERAQAAMDSLNTHLIDRRAGLVKLLDPPFDVGEFNPGYIKGYVPGVRENGGQYTHAAIWAIMAFAALGDAERAWELLALINPINHTKTAQDLATYKAEPYVLAADVYGVAPHLGRGGWTWYTGSAGLCYRLILESLLGINRIGNQLHIHPCIPRAWQTYAIDYRFGSTLYNIVVNQSLDASESCASTTRTLKLDAELQTQGYIVCVDDHQPHRVELMISRSEFE